MRSATEETIFVSPKEAMEMSHDNSVLVIVDTHSRDLLESQDLYNVCGDIVVIDHHRKMVNYIDRTVVFYHEPFASAASEMVTELVEYLADSKLEQKEADALLAGMMLDTKNFVLKTGVRTFEAAAFLRKKGADTVSVKGLFADSFDTYKAKYQIVSQAEIYHNMAISLVTEPHAEVRLASAQAADELLSIRGVDVSFVLFPVAGGINISARSYGKVNVQVIMEKLGGGGHLTMAGAMVRDVSPDEAKKRLLDAIDEYRAQQIPEVDVNHII
jgi:c-di-AMP phosphodiesterase-like protein